MKTPSVRLTLTVEQAVIVTDLLSICREKVPFWAPESFEEKWHIGAVLARSQRSRLDDAIERFRRCLARGAR